MVFSVTLNFRGAKSLTKKTTLILTFDQQSMEGMYDTYNPVAWKVTAFPAGGGGSFKATYTADLAVARVQIDNGIVEAASYSTHINLLQQTTLTVDSSSDPETYAFTKPETWKGAKPGQFLISNKTGAYQDIGIGFYEKGHQDPVANLVMNDVPGNTSVPAEFTPILSAYVASGYKQTQIIKAQIQSDLDWSKNLTNPSLHLDWRLEESGEGFTLVEDSPA
ncbi:hypothetical protein M413DRAFT_12700 [Hebeloma cylindrosporum]|uniref:Uncharacterized protein n=1 Tax=Hebeloma cylindrosporum TaxID=76867 RepID=A0A0C2YBU6_HEBCY|nr:hypothetical protein M413DRAFT_12700 [Hebeloma cylindrosporum h7]